MKRRSRAAPKTRATKRSKSSSRRSKRKGAGSPGFPQPEGSSYDTGGKTATSDPAPDPTYAALAFFDPTAPQWPTLTATLDHGGNDRQGFPGPPKFTCECGAEMRVEYHEAEGTSNLAITDRPHARDCLFLDWPRVVQLAASDW